MSFLAKSQKIDLIRLEKDLDIRIYSTLVLSNLITSSNNYKEDLAKYVLTAILAERTVKKNRESQLQEREFQLQLERERLSVQKLCLELYFTRSNVGVGQNGDQNPCSKSLGESVKMIRLLTDYPPNQKNEIISFQV
ncbi:hypothetical protein NPIL_349221 [Nephila pilipes]|uniref:Uncharacterized protein n=1 Tax=Nephila pilipes TaxID=299642 RepID=A0A8X6R107_NEPPI|nr:hypothetical protein NPIL_349221 [Nephila pilipes]